MKFGERISAAWPIVKENIVPFVVGMLIAGILMGTVVLMGPMMIGLYTMCLKAARKERVEIGDVFAGFQNAGPTIVLGLVWFVISLVAGTITLGLGNLVILPMSMWSYAYLADRKGEWKPALDYSIDLMKKDWVTALVLPFLLVFVLGFVGMLACCIGMYVTLPIAYVAHTLVYLEMQGNGKGGTVSPA